MLCKVIQYNVALTTDAVGLDSGAEVISQSFVFHYSYFTLAFYSL